MTLLKEHIKALTLLLFILISSSSAFGVDFSLDKIKKDRKEKDEYFRKGKDSPIPKEEQKKFKGLKYYTPDKNFLIAAKFDKYSEPDTVMMKTSKKERIKSFLRYGKFTFKFQGKNYSLTAYLILPLSAHNELFVPFVDLSCEKDSYSAGRYLDIPETPSKKDYILDFNSAYNPYCTYNKKYTCPLVPPENYLPIDIRAGERKYKNE